MLRRVRFGALVKRDTELKIDLGITLLLLQEVSKVGNP
jgi:hypothetical protein